ncbi:uncharacterized protein BJX67DRAFT_361709 [Aspergillus lucknowensis]|uniref:Secreted protein n=1 Tax=Aspergillus lucknowensis TaxID=176173 RepID=A0ABR4LIA4_9EURO
MFLWLPLLPFAAPRALEGPRYRQRGIGLGAPSACASSLSTSSHLVDYRPSSLLCKLALSLIVASWIYEDAHWNNHFLPGVLPHSSGIFGVCPITGSPPGFSTFGRSLLSPLLQTSLAAFL